MIRLFPREETFLPQFGRAVEINRLENEADTVAQLAIGKLFAEAKDPIEVMKWKEIYDFVEGATDRCEDVANTLEAIVIKST